MVRMKATLTLDDDVAAFLRAQARLHDKPLPQIVNDMLRRGMSSRADGSPAGEEHSRQPHRVPTFSSGYVPGIDAGDPRTFKNLLNRLDDEHFREIQSRTAADEE